MATISPPRNLPGLQDYEIQRLLGEGGMGKVFLARHSRSGEKAVVKIIHEHLLGEAKTRQRFQQETDLMRRFQHPNAVTYIHASPPQAAFPFIVMEYVRGITLDELMKQHDRLPPARVGRLLAPLCLFLQAAHDNGLLHRDLTPANLMVVDAGMECETIKVMDFGLSRRIGFYIPSGQLNSESSAIDGGTPDYICPEQIEGRQVDHRGDLFSVGVLLYGLLTGHVPFETLTDPNAILHANLHQSAPRFSHWHVTDVPSMIEGLVHSCLSKTPAHRPESARALMEAFQMMLGKAIVTEQAFEDSREHAVSSLHEIAWYDPRCMIDQFEATMVEHTASIKLRGFVDGVGGQVIESDAGVIKVKLPRITEVESKKGLLSWFKPKVEQQVDWIGLELHMAKTQASARSLVEITVVHSQEDAARKNEYKSFCEQTCRELRAYLMVGR